MAVLCRGTAAPDSPLYYPPRRWEILVTMNVFVCFVAALCSLIFTLPTFAQGTAFTYQGRLIASGAPASGSYDFRFRLATDSAGNNYLGNPILTNALPVVRVRRRHTFLSCVCELGRFVGVSDASSFRRSFLCRYIQGGFNLMKKFLRSERLSDEPNRRGAKRMRFVMVKAARHQNSQGRVQCDTSVDEMFHCHGVTSKICDEEPRLIRLRFQCGQRIDAIVEGQDTVAGVPQQVGV